MDKLCSDLYKVVNRLLTYPDWLPVHRCQISFYCWNLRHFSQRYQNFFAEAFDTSRIPSLYTSAYTSKLTILVNEILYSQYNQGSSKLHLLSANALLNSVGNELLWAIYDYYIIKEKKLPQNSTFLEFFSRTFSFDIHGFKEYEGEVCVGFDMEATNLLHQLASTTTKKLEILSIVGMAGLGKTTLAKRLYNDPYIVSYFYVRAWVTCSQVYQKRDFLLAVLSFVIELTEETYTMDTNELAHQLYRALMGRRYLIVIDDIWSIDAWDDLKRFFPNDNNGSKIMLTTRLKDVALHAQSNKNPLDLRFLTEEESFDLFRRKCFLIGIDTDILYLTGKVIASKCRGLPLAIVVIAGLLKNNFEIHWWINVEESVSSYIVGDENQYMDTLEMSYNHLPQHLRTCFLYFGTFPEDSDIPVCKLIRFWIAEGLVSTTGTKNLEDVAEEYLMDLIGRSLVVASKKTLNGAIKTSLIHDLLHELCLRKANAENFSPKIYKCRKQSYSCAYCSVSDASSTDPPTQTQECLSTHVSNISSKCFRSCYEAIQSIFKDMTMSWGASKLITALDLSSTELCIFPCEILELEQLRYLELRFRYGNPPESISLLTELQTLIMSSRNDMVVPGSMWKIKVLRHLCIKSGENLVNFSFEEESGLLENMQTMSLVSPTRPCGHILSRTPHLRKLGLCGPLTRNGTDLECPDLSCLMNLESLKLLNTIPLFKARSLSNSIIFPHSLKILVVSSTYLDWKEAWLFEMIPNLEVLKLKLHAFVGEEWETSSGLFPRLKIFKLEELDIVTLTTSSDHFPVLQRLVVHRCPYLMEIPADFGDICTLQWIELSGCSDAAIHSARDIQKEQENNGNDWLQIFIKPQPVRKEDDKKTDVDNEEEEDDVEWFNFGQDTAEN